MPGNSACVNRRAAVKFKSIPSAHSSSVPRPAIGRDPPALLIKISTSPKCLAVTLWIRSAIPSDVMSSTIINGRSAPVAAISSATCCNRFSRRASIANRHPSLASLLAIATPSPILAPVTKAVLPVSCRSMSCSHWMMNKISNNSNIVSGLRKIRWFIKERKI